MNFLKKNNSETEKQDKKYKKVEIGSREENVKQIDDIIKFIGPRNIKETYKIKTLL